MAMAESISGRTRGRSGEAALRRRGVDGAADPKKEPGAFDVPVQKVKQINSKRYVACSRASSWSLGRWVWWGLRGLQARGCECYSTCGGGGGGALSLSLSRSLSLSLSPCITEKGTLSLFGES